MPILILKPALLKEQLEYGLGVWEAEHRPIQRLAGYFEIPLSRADQLPLAQKPQSTRFLLKLSQIITQSYSSLS